MNWRTLIPVTSSEFSLLADARRVLVVDDDPLRATRFSSLLEKDGMSPVVCDNPQLAVAAIYGEPPDALLVHAHLGEKGGLELARLVKQDNVFAHLPVMLLVPDSWTDELLADPAFPFDDFLSDRAGAEEILARVRLSLIRARRQLDANPLTRLPGNNSIAKELEKRIALKEAFATVYIDLDNFKAFNDRYGFARGDQALKMTARLVVNSVSAASPKDYYVGHVGGDDFIYIVPEEKAESSCQAIINHFDTIILTLYDDVDREAGCIHSTNRKGEKETFPLMTISLAVVVNQEGQFSHPGEISAISAELKKNLKKMDGSNYLLDRRRYETGG